MRARLVFVGFVLLIALAVGVGSRAGSQPYPSPATGPVDAKHFGQFVQTIVPTPGYANLVVVPAGGLYVTVQPVTGQIGGVVQLSTAGSPPQFGVVGIREGALAPLGPFPTNAFINTVSLVECQVSGGDVFCKMKPNSGVIDTGWVGVANVTVIAGAKVVASGGIVMRPPIAFTINATVAGRPNCTLNIVYDLGADPNGIIDATGAINAGFATATATKGAILCAPPGQYLISGDLTVPIGIAGAGFIGAGSGATVLNETNLASNVFDSCPTNAAKRPTRPIPANCPGTLGANQQINGGWFTGFTVNYVSQAAPACNTPCPGATGLLAGWGPSAFDMPAVNGLIVDGIDINDAWDCFDLGQQTSASVQFFVIRDSANILFCNGESIAYHGGVGAMTVEHNEWKSGRSNGLNPVFTGVEIDTSDLEGFNHSTSLYEANDWEGPTFGLFGLIDSNSGIQDSRWIANIMDGASMADYYLAAVPNLTSNFPETEHLTFNDKWTTSWYNGFWFDGGGYSGASGGPKAVQIGGPALVAGSNTKGNGSSFFLLSPYPGSTLAPTGFAGDGSGVSITYTPAGPATPFTCTYTAAPGDNPRTIAYGLVNACGSNQTVAATPNPTGAPVQIGTTYLGNPNYGAVPQALWSPMGQTLNTAMPYQVITTGHLIVTQLASPYPLCTPLPLQLGGKNASPAPCYQGAFDNGDSVSFRNSARGQRIVNMQLGSNNGAAIQCWDSPGICRQLYVASNSMGEGSHGGEGTYVGLVFPKPGSSNAPTDYAIIGNDFSGGTLNNNLFVNPPPPQYPTLATAPPAPLALNTTAPSLGQAPGIVIGNRGAFGSAASVFALAIPTPISLTTNYLYYNLSPYACTYYLSANGATVSNITLNGLTTLPNTTTQFRLSPGQQIGFTFSAGPPTVVGQCDY
jgi:Pectate lyase superfamily protein